MADDQSRVERAGAASALFNRATNYATPGMRETMAKYNIESSDLDYSVRAARFEYELDQRAKDVIQQRQIEAMQNGGEADTSDPFRSDEITSYFVDQAKEIGGKIGEMTRDELKNNIVRLEHLQESLFQSDAKEKEFLMMQYDRNLKFMQEEYKRKHNLMARTTTKMGELAEQYMDIRSMYAGFVDNNPIAMGLFKIGSDMLSNYRKNKAEKKNLIEADAHRVIMAEKTEALKAAGIEEDQRRAEELSKFEKETIEDDNNGGGPTGGGTTERVSETASAPQAGVMERENPEQDFKDYSEDAQADEQNRIVRENFSEQMKVIQNTDDNVEKIVGLLEDSLKVQEEHLKAYKDETGGLLDELGNLADIADLGGDLFDRRRRGGRNGRPSRTPRTGGRGGRLGRVFGGVGDFFRSGKARIGGIAGNVLSGGRNVAGRVMDGGRNLLGNARNVAGGAGNLLSRGVQAGKGVIGSVARAAPLVATAAGGLLATGASKAAEVGTNVASTAGRVAGNVASTAGNVASSAGNIVREGATTAGRVASTAGNVASTGARAAGGLGRSLLKKIPGVGLAVAGGMAVDRMMGGDLIGAGGELLSGLASLIPGIGTAASVAIDAGLMARDMANDSEATVESAAETARESAIPAGALAGTTGEASVNSNPQMQARIEAAKERGAQMKERSLTGGALVGTAGTTGAVIAGAEGVNAQEVRTELSSDNPISGIIEAAPAQESMATANKIEAAVMQIEEGKVQVEDKRMSMVAQMASAGNTRSVGTTASTPNVGGKGGAMAITPLAGARNPDSSIERVTDRMLTFGMS